MLDPLAGFNRISNASTLAEAEDDGFAEKTRPLMLFRVSQETAAYQTPNILSKLLNYIMSPGRPLFMIIRTKPWYSPDRRNFYYGGRPSYVHYRFTMENFLNIMHAISHPFQTYYDETTEIEYSDFLFKIDRERQNNFERALEDGVLSYRDAPKISEITHIGFFSTPRERSEIMALSKTSEKLPSLIYKEFDEVFQFDTEEGIHRSVRKGLFLPYAFCYEKLENNNDEMAVWWSKAFKDEGIKSQMLQLQIPWGREDVLKESEEGGIRDVIFSIPCLLYALKDQISEQVYDKLRDEKIIFGVGAKTQDFKKVLYDNGYKFDIIRIQNVDEGRRFKINTDHYKPKNGENFKLVRLMFWEGHWMKYMDGWLRILENTKRAGLLRHLNAYEFAQLYDNYSFDKMLKFDEKEFVEKHESNYEFTDKDYGTLEANDTKVPKIIYFADFEASVDEAFHIPYLIGYSSINLIPKGKTFECVSRGREGEGSYWGRECGKLFLNYLIELYGVARTNKPKKIRIYFYNLHYDFTFIQPYVYNIKRVMKGRILYSVNASYTNQNKVIELDFWDALPIFKTTLKKAANSYLTPEQKEKIKKEVFPYELYTYTFFDTYPNKLCPKHLFIQALGDKANELDPEVEDYCTHENEFAYGEYAIYYCMQDVRCLQNIMINFDRLLSGGNLDGINGNLPFCMPLWKYRTASTIGYEFFKRTTMLTSEKNPLHNWIIPKCTLRHFIQQTIRGGRVMTRDNKTWVYSAKNEKEYLQDYDGVSLYPSAMSMLWLTEGVPKFIKGEFNENDIKNLFTHPDAPMNQFLKYNDGCIHVTYINVHKEKHFPLLCVKDKSTGLNNYQNFHGEVDTWVNVIDLFNLIDFQEAEIKWNYAIVWEGKRFYEIRDNIKELFEFRAKNKEHPIQLVIKLILNSIFGKSILKPQNTEKQLVPKTRYRYNSTRGDFDKIDAWQEYFDANAYRIHRFEELDKFYDVEIYKRDTSTSFNIFGSNVLAMARRIIGRVMSLAEELEEQHPEMSPGLFYTDTDSMHIRSDLLELLEIEYKNRYGKEIKGKDLTQFHIDFDPPETFKEGEKTLGACESYFLMKKTYADKLIGDQGSYAYHMRMKGIPIDLVSYEDYKAIANGESITFDLLDGHTSFYYKNGKVGTRLTMTREIMTKETREKRKLHFEEETNKKTKTLL